MDPLQCPVMSGCVRGGVSFSSLGGKLLAISAPGTCRTPLTDLDELPAVPQGRLRQK